MNNKSISLLIYCLLFFSLHSFSQTHILDKKNSQLSIIGTSSLHDWVSVVEKFDASADIESDQIKNIEFQAIVKSIKSGKSGMDKNIYTALKEKNNPKIIFKSNSLAIQGDKLVGKGNLTIAGKTNEVSVSLSLLQENNIIISGHFDIKMTDYGISPPTAIFGTVKTGDDISLEMTFTMNQK